MRQMVCDFCGKVLSHEEGLGFSIYFRDDICKKLKLKDADYMHNFDFCSIECLGTYDFITKYKKTKNGNKKNSKK